MDLMKELVRRWSNSKHIVKQELNISSKQNIFYQRQDKPVVRKVSFFSYEGAWQLF